MKRALAVLIQIVLFVTVFAVFSFLQPFGIHWFVSHPGPTVTRYFVADGFLLTTALWLLILVIEAVTGRIARAGMWSTVCYFLAVVASFAVKLGFITHDLYS